MTLTVVTSLVAAFGAGAAVGALVLVAIGIRSEDPRKILTYRTRTRTGAAVRRIANVQLRRPELPQDEEGRR